MTCASLNRHSLEAFCSLLVYSMVAGPQPEHTTHSVCPACVHDAGSCSLPCH